MRTSLPVWARQASNGGTVRRLRLFGTVTSCFAVAAFLFAKPAYASQIVFSNLGPGDSFQPNTSWAMNCYDAAASFTSAGSFSLDSVEIALRWDNFPGTTNDEDIWLMSDSAGLP
jgi:hypothetical protein